MSSIVNGQSIPNGLPGSVQPGAPAGPAPQIPAEPTTTGSEPAAGESSPDEIVLAILYEQESGVWGSSAASGSNNAAGTPKGLAAIMAPIGTV
jgi:hypothetical protein